MHLEEAHGGENLPERGGVEADKAPKFVRKLHDMVSNPRFEQHICWTPAGDAIQIVRPMAFSHEVLPLYFRHSNLRSFTRQLNMYGFRRRIENARYTTFYHPRFRRGNSKDIAMISRNQVTAADDEKKPAVDMHSALAALRQQQESMSAHIEDVFYRLANVEMKLGVELNHLAQRVEMLRYSMARISGHPGMQYGPPPQ